MFILNPPQLHVIDALSNGASLTDAAAQAGIHRNTIANWRLNSPDFREALAITRHDRALLYRDRAVDLADLAFETLRNVLTDPKSSPSTRLRAAIFIIDKVSTPPKFEKEEPASLPDMLAAMEEAAHAHLAQQQPPEPANDAQNCTTVHNDAEPEPVSQLHNSAQPPETYRRPQPKIGRNDTCPCGSGRKYKHCCLGKSSAAAA
ncbi:MAG: SEC-C metal-binding domain-containing protein [Bryobacteraceae bacterium]|jgi:lambda repressor-like predicted transcriptional regulator